MSTTISPQQFQDQHGHDEAVRLIDVRTPLEFQEVHATSARNIPLDQLDPVAVMQEYGSADQPLFVICKSGARAAKAQQAFQAAGFSNVVNVTGGTDHWAGSGLPVVRGRQAMSLERQVRIAAGSIVLTGAILALVLHPWWAVVPAFVGAGLVFAGLSDWCGMGLLLAKMPWNKVRPPAADGSSSGCRLPTA